MSNSKTTTSLSDARDMAAEYSRIYNSINYCGQNHLKLVDEMVFFRDRIQKLVEESAPDYFESFQKIIRKYDRICELATEISNSEVRCSEDLRDVVERFRVVSRISTEHYHIMLNADETATTLSEIQQMKTVLISTPKWEKEGPKIEDMLKSAITKREEALIAAKEKTLELIEAQKAYQNFKLRRMKHAWHQFANTIRQNSTDVATIFAEISQDLKDICKQDS